MRWWLAAAFAVIASLTAVVVAEVFTSRSEAAFRERAQTIAAGSTFTAAVAVGKAAEKHRLPAEIVSIARRHGLALFVFDARGHLITASRSRGLLLDSVPGRRAAITTALAGHRFVESYARGRTIVVALPLRRGGTAALVAVGSRPELVAENRILHDEIAPAAIWAVLAGCIAGLLVATLITIRLRRIARVSSEIERGSFTHHLDPRFPDELGELAATVDRMRVRLRDSFAELEAERDRLRVLLERLHDGVVAVDDDLNVEFANPAAGELLGARLEVGTRLPAWQPFALDDFARSLFLPGATAAQERADLDDGPSYSIVGLPAGGTPPVAVIVLSDVTAQERRERAEREFVANAAHELRTPVAAIASAVEVLENGAKEHPLERDRFLRIVSRQSGRLNRLVRALLVLARAQTREEAVPFESVQLLPVLEDVATDLRTGISSATRIIVDCPPGLCATGHCELIEEIVSNLASNAAKHGAPGEIVLRAREVASGVTIEIHDSGPGIRPEQRERLFDRFYRGSSLDTEGFGLGLAIAREAVAALGGRIELVGRPGGGTTARVTFESQAARAA